MKKLGLTTITLATLLLTGCGGGGGSDSKNTTNTASIKDKDVIAVFKNLPSSMQCTSDAFKTISQAQLDKAKIANLTLVKVSSSTTCETYGKISEDGTCFESDYSELYPGGTLSCVMAYDLMD